MTIIDEIAGIIEEKLSYTNGWRISEEQYTGHCYEIAKNIVKLFYVPVVSISLPSRKDYEDRNLKPMFFKEDTTVDGKVLFVKGDEWKPYNWNYSRTIEYLKDGRLGYER